MCRLVLYKGKAPIQLAHLLTRPAHSIIKQSLDSRLRLGKTRAINGDGFGVGWYDSSQDDENHHDSAETPCIFTSVTPAWNNLNLTRLADKIRSPLVFAHVRASTSASVSEANCHPWRYGRLMWMHNGNIAQFDRIKRRLHNSLSEKLYNFVQGNTDSEFAFALFLNQFEDPLHGPFDHISLKKAMLATIAQLNVLAEEAGNTEPSLMNFVVTDGSSVVCTRYVSSLTSEAASLYYSSGTRFEEFSSGHYRMIKADRREDIVLVASEPLTFEKADWLTIPSNTCLVITPKLNVLVYPIIDQFHNPDPNGRGSDVVTTDVPTAEHKSSYNLTATAVDVSSSEALKPPENGIAHVPPAPASTTQLRNAQTAPKTSQLLSSPTRGYNSLPSRIPNLPSQNLSRRPTLVKDNRSLSFTKGEDKKRQPRFEKPTQTPPVPQLVS